MANAVPVEDRRKCEDEEGRKEVEQVAGEDNKNEIGVWDAPPGLGGDESDPYSTDPGRWGLGNIDQQVCAYWA